MKTTKGDLERPETGRMGFLIAGAILVTCGLILLVPVLVTYVILGGYAPGGGRFLLASLILLLVGYGIFSLGHIFFKRATDK